MFSQTAENMQRLTCPTCGNEVFFDSMQCVVCETVLAIDVDVDGSLTLGDAAEVGSCLMRDWWRCNWRPQTNEICASCLIVDAGEHADNTLLIPFLAAQRRALAQLSLLGIDWTVHNGAGPIGPPLVFTYRSTEAGDAATIGHLDGLITLDLDEANPAQLEQIRTTLGELYRTPLGHIRHELGHYVWQRLVANDPARLTEFREVFGDETVDYSEALEAHYARGDDGSWRKDHVSFYAAAHPWEDYAESWAQVMHVHDVVSTGLGMGRGQPPTSTVRACPMDVDGGAGHPRRQRAGEGDGHARPVPVRPLAGCPAQGRGGVASDTPERFSLTSRPTSGIVAGPDPPADNHCEIRRPPSPAEGGTHAFTLTGQVDVRTAGDCRSVGRRKRRQCRHGHHDPRRHRRRGH